MGFALRRKVAAKDREEELSVKSSQKREVQLPRGGRVAWAAPRRTGPSHLAG